MKLFDQISNGLNRVMNYAITFLLIWMTVVLVIQVGARYLLDSGMPWTEEMARFANIWVVFLGATIVGKEMNHINIPIVEDRYPSIKTWLVPLQRVITIIYLAFLVKIGIDAIPFVSSQLSANMRISMGIVYAIIPIACVIMLIHMIVDFRKAKTSSEEGQLL